MKAPHIPSRWLRRLRLSAISLLAAAVLFGAFGFFAGPPLARMFLVKILAEQLHRPVSISAVHINPYAMSVRVDGLTVGDGHGGETFAFDELFVDLSLASVIHAAPVIEEFRIKGPRIHVARVAPGRYDISDLLDEWLKPSDTPTPKFSVNNIKITDGRVDFDDRPVGKKHAITDINIALPFISNLAYQADKYTEPAFSTVINGAPLKLNGKSKPFASVRESELKLDLNHFALGPYLPYLPFPLPFTVADGQVSTDLSLVFRQGPKEPATLNLTGRITLSGLRLLEGKKPLLNLAKLDMPLAALAPLSNQFKLGNVGIDGLEIFVRTQADGGLNLLALAGKLPGGGGKTAPANADAKSKADKVKSEADTKGKTDTKDKADQESKAAAKPEPQKPLQVDVAGLHLSKAVLHWQDGAGRDTGPSATLNSFKLTDIHMDVPSQHVRISAVALDGLNLAATRLADGQIAGLQSLMAKPGIPASSSVSRKAPPVPPRKKRRQAAKTAPAAPAWLVEIAKTSVANVGLRLEDQAVKPAVIQTMDITKLNLSALSTAPKTTTNLDINVLLNKKGALDVSGPVQLTPLSCKLKVDLRGLELLPLQPYFADKVNLTVTKGQLTGAGELALSAAPDGSLSGGVKGQLTLGNFHSVDKINNADFLTWRSLHLGGVNVAFKPFAVAVGDVALSDFYARLIISPKGKLNVLQLVKKNEKTTPQATTDGKPEAKTEAKTEPPAPQAPAPQSGATQTAATQVATTPVTPVRIAKVTLQGGTVSFTDHFIKPNYSAKLASIGGRITGLSSDPGSTADMDLRGTYEGAPLTIAGKLNPFSASPALDIKTEVRGVELTPMSPYFGKYAGYALKKGKLSLYLSYKIADRKLTAENRVFLDQLTFGDRVESPDATKLPVSLAVALLTNRRGEIDVNLPISGSLDDPQFSVGGIVVQVILNLLGKAVTAPFALLGSLFSGGEELSHVDFAPGYAKLSADTLQRLESLAKALNDRPALTLEVAGSVDPEKDREGLRHAWLEHQVKARKLAQLIQQRKEAGSVDEVVVDPKEYPALLAQAYKLEKFPKPRNFIGLTKSLPQEEMEKLMLANAPVSDEDLLGLANRRATAVADWLRAGGKIPAERVFLLPPKPLPKQGADSGGKKDVSLSRVDFSLK